MYKVVYTGVYDFDVLPLVAGKGAAAVLLVLPDVMEYVFHLFFHVGETDKSRAFSLFWQVSVLLFFHIFNKAGPDAARRDGPFPVLTWLLRVAGPGETGRHAVTRNTGWQPAAAYTYIIIGVSTTLTQGKMNAKPQKLVFLPHIARASRAWAAGGAPLPRPITAPVFLNGL